MPMAPSALEAAHSTFPRQSPRSVLQQLLPGHGPPNGRPGHVQDASVVLQFSSGRSAAVEQAQVSPHSAAVALPAVLLCRVSRRCPRVLPALPRHQAEVHRYRDKQRTRARKGPRAPGTVAAAAAVPGSSSMPARGQGLAPGTRSSRRVRHHIGGRGRRGGRSSGSLANPRATQHRGWKCQRLYRATVGCTLR